MIIFIKQWIYRVGVWATTRQIRWVICAFIGTFFIQLFFVKYFAVNIPFWDEWSELLLFSVFEQGNGGEKLKALFEQHNEHRVFIARLIFLGSYYLLDDWNPLSHMLGSAFIVGCCAALVIYILLRLDYSSWTAIFACIILTSAIQFDNIITGFQISLYLLLLGMIVSIYLFVIPDKIGWKEIILLISSCSFCSFTTASGLFVWIIALSGLFLKAWFEKKSLQGILVDYILLIKILTCLTFAVMCTLLYLYHYRSPSQHESLKAHTLVQAGVWFIKVLNYPLLENVNLVTILLSACQWIVISLGIVIAFVRRQNVLYQRKILFLTSLLLFLGINAGITAYSRGATIGGMPSRYGSLFLWTSIVFFLAADDILRSSLSRSKYAIGGAFLVFSCVTGVALVQMQQSIAGIAQMSQVKTERLQMRTTLIAELRDPQYTVEGVEPIPIPFLLQQLRNDPSARALLPHWLQAQINAPLAATITGDAWIAGWGNPELSLSFSGWGSWRGKEHIAATGRLESEPIHITQPFLVLPVTGYPTIAGNRLIIQPVEGSNKDIEYTDANPGISTLNWYVDLSDFVGQDVRIIAIDGNISDDGWFSFENPWQMNYMSRLLYALFG